MEIVNQKQDHIQSQIDDFLQKKLSSYPNKFLNLSLINNSQDISNYVYFLEDTCDFFNEILNNDIQNVPNNIIYIYKVLKEYKITDHLFTMTFDRNFFKPNLIQVFNESITPKHIQVELLNSLNPKLAQIFYDFLSISSIPYTFANEMLNFLYLNKSKLNIDTSNIPIIEQTHEGVKVDHNKIIRDWRATNLYLNLYTIPNNIVNNLSLRLINLIQERYKNINLTQPQSPELVIKELIEIDRNLIEYILLESEEEFITFRQTISSSLNLVLNNHRLSLDLINEILKHSNFTKIHRHTILEFCKKSKLIKYRERVKKVLFCLLNKETHNFLKPFLNIQVISNRGAQRFSKVCELLSNIIKTNQLKSPYQEIKLSQQLILILDPQEFQTYLEQMSLTHLLKKHDLEEILNFLSPRAKDKLTLILIKLTYFESIIEKEQLQSEIRHLITYAIENQEAEAKICCSNASEDLKLATIESFLQNTQLQTVEGVCEETVDLNQVLAMGVVPTITCFSYINGFHKREVLGFAMLDDRKLVQFKQGNTIYSRASFKLLAPYNLDHSRHAIFIDNFYGRPQDLQYFVELAFHKSRQLGLELCIPVTHERLDVENAFIKSLFKFTKFEETDLYNQHHSNILNMNYSDTISQQMVLVTGELVSTSSSTLTSTTR
jgi:hypothetical protein